jgi:hypothetical protein
VTSSRGAGLERRSPFARVRDVGARILGVGACLAAAGCTASTKATSQPPESARRAERAPVWPAPAIEAEAGAGVCVLRPPPARQLARRTVQAFFDAVRKESVGELSTWLAEDATISSGPGTTPESIAKVWAARFKQLDYGFSGAKEPYRADDVGLFTADELVGLLPARRFELVPDADEVLAVVTTRDRRRAAGPRHFGKRLEFVLGPSAEGYRIRRMFEDFRLP